jgi:hypothetical protein
MPEIALGIFRGSHPETRIYRPRRREDAHREEIFASAFDVLGQGSIEESLEVGGRVGCIQS